jgi:predicted nucleic acid-binding protein
LLTPGTPGGWLERLTPILESRASALIIALAFTAVVTWGLSRELTRQQMVTRELYSALQAAQLAQIALAERLGRCTAERP